MPKHAVPAGPEGDAIRKRLRHQRLARTREWLVRSYLPLSIPLIFARSIDASWYFYPLYLVAGIALIAAFALADRCATRLSARMGGPRPRAVYLSLACGWLAVAVPCAVVGERMGQQTGWRSNALGMTMFLCGAMALVMLGRAVTWGRVRPYFWLHPPAGVGADRPSAVPDAPDQAQA